MTSKHELATRMLYLCTVHASNMTKMTGVRTGVGKAVKGRSFRRPEIEAILESASKRTVS